MPEEVVAATPFVCECDVTSRDACKGEFFYKEQEGKRYCVFHFPGVDKNVDFEKALKRKLDAKDFDFSGVWFPDIASFSYNNFDRLAIFSGATFNAGVYFDEAKFSEGVLFHRATFNAKAYFSRAHFSEQANFASAIFNGTGNFKAATFNAQAIFVDAIFESVADFSNATFAAMVNFEHATFKDYVRFGYSRREGDKEGTGFSEQSWLNLEHAKIEEPEHIAFHELILRPHWFINVDSRKFDFVNVE